MTSWKLVRIIAGLLILLSLTLGVAESPFFVSKYWLYFTAFIGVNLFQSGITNWCLMENIMRKFGVRGGC
jgi:hypothetical protein